MIACNTLMGCLLSVVYDESSELRLFSFPSPPNGTFSWLLIG